MPRLSTCFLASLVLVTAGSSLSAQSPRPLPVLVKASPASGDTITGELLEERLGHLLILDLRTGQRVSISESDLRSYRSDVSEYEAVQTVGLANYLSWQIQRSTKAGRLQGKIASIDGDVVYCTLGGHDGVELEEQFEIIRIGDPIRHPDTDELLGYEQSRIGSVVIDDVQDTLSRGTLQVVGEADVRVGDIIRVPPEQHAIVVMPLVDSGNFETVFTRRLAEELTTGLVQRHIRVVERRQLLRVIGELGLESTSSFDPATRARMGELLGAEAMVMGTSPASGSITRRRSASSIWPRGKSARR